MNHRITELRSPVAITLRCSCGWVYRITKRQNALARAAKLRAAYARHEREASDTVAPGGQ